MGDIESTETVEKPKKRRVLTKDLASEPGTVILEAGGGTGPKKYIFNELPSDIQGKLGPFGLGHKLGDAAAGRKGSDAEEAIDKVWAGLKSGDWSVRAPAQPKIKESDILSKYNNMTDKEKKAAKPLLEALGIPVE